jgi:predicted nuclease of predicted toxin-antitoxin system
MPRPRIYADANVPAGLVAFMRGELEWDVLFVMEEDGLRRAPDLKHYRLAHQLRRTLVTMDRDYLDDRRFPPEESAGVLVINAPDERELSALLARVDRSMFQRDAPDPAPLPLEHRKLHINTDWGRDAE